VVAKHRRAEPESSPGSAGAPVSTAAAWHGAVGRGQAAAHARALPSGGGYFVPNGYDGAATDPGWAAPDGEDWQDRQDWRNPRDWGPLPELHPDHPSAPVPRIQVPGDYDGGGQRRLHAVPTDAPDVYQAAPAVRAPQETRRYQRQGGPGGPGGQEATAYRRETGPFGSRPEPATGWFENGRAPGNSFQAAGQVLPLSDDRAAQIAAEAQAYATALREAAEREAATITAQAAAQAVAIREAAEREAAQRRAELDSMTGELGRVAAYVTENLGAPAMLATAPALPAVRPAVPGTTSAPPVTRPARPDTRPAKPATGPARPAARPDAKPARPDTRPAAAPDKKPQKPGRQRQAMRVASYGTATLLAFAVLTGATEIGLHGFKFFVFRGGGVGQTSGSETDQQFLARQAPPHHVPAPAPKGRHHKA
jgi:hypothetical protein